MKNMNTTMEIWMSCKKFTVWVKILPLNETWVIADAAPIVSKFIGQPVINLKVWMEEIGDFRCVKNYL